MDPANPPALLLDENEEVMGVEWEAADVGQGPMEMFGQTIEIQPGHPGVEEPHYMMHIYFKPGGKVLFGTIRRPRSIRRASAPRCLPALVQRHRERYGQRHRERHS
jgi:hypothetical protein